MSMMGRAIKAIREAKGLQQQTVVEVASRHLGERMGANVLSQIENGKIVRPDFERVRAIAQALGMTYNELLVAGGWADPFEAGESVEHDALEDLARDHPEVEAQLEEIKANNPPELYAEARQVLAKFMTMGVEAARDHAARRKGGPAGD